jgi:two-component system sensor histidine kinase VanS
MKLSEPFLRRSGRVNKSNREKKGYGLSLALVSRITEVHNGTLTILPRPDGGLAITVSLPTGPVLTAGDVAGLPRQIGRSHRKRDHSGQ